MFEYGGLVLFQKELEAALPASDPIIEQGRRELWEGIPPDMHYEMLSKFVKDHPPETWPGFSKPRDDE